MTVTRILILSLLTIAIYSCSTEEDIPSSVEPPVDNPTGNVYFEQNKWIYAQMNQHYLWRDDLPDSLSCDFDQTPKDFFKSLLSDKDRFSYMLTNSTYTPASAHALMYQTYKDAQGNTASVILHVDKSMINNTSIERGSWINIISMDDSSITFNEVELTDESFVYSNKIVTLSISTPSSQQSTVLLDSIYNDATAYLCYKEFDDVEDLLPALQKFKERDVKELILDLRYNPGGYVSTCKYLANCIAPEHAYGDIFQITRYNDRISINNIRNTGHAELYNNFGYPVVDDGHSKGGPAIIPLNLSRVFVLTSTHTASASEATILCLKPYMDVIQIGETTVGKGVGSYTLRDRRFKYAIQPITMQYYNRDGVTVSNSGLIPDYYIAEGYKVPKKDLGDIHEPLLSMALALINAPNLTTARSITPILENSLTPVGEPSYVTEFKNKYHNESD